MIRAAATGTTLHSPRMDQGPAADRVKEGVIVAAPASGLPIFPSRWAKKKKASAHVVRMVSPRPFTRADHLYVRQSTCRGKGT